MKTGATDDVIAARGNRERAMSALKWKWLPGQDSNLG